MKLQKKTSLSNGLKTYFDPIWWINVAAWRMSEIVLSGIPPSKADASFKFGVTKSAIGRSSSLQTKEVL